MAKKFRIAPSFYRWARKINTIEAFLSGDVRRILRRLVNRYIGRILFSPKRLGRIWKWF